jgi:hypothetical protein
MLPTTSGVQAGTVQNSVDLRKVDLSTDQALNTPRDGGCSIQYYYDDTCTYGYAWPLPQDSSDWFAVRFTNDEVTACTLTVIRIKLYRPFMTGTPDLQICVYDDDGFGLPGTPLATETVAYADLPPDHFGWAEVDFAAPLVFGAGEEFHIGITSIGGVGDTLYPLTDAGTGPHAGEDRSETHSPSDGLWYTLNSFYGVDFVFMFEAEMCCVTYASISGTKFHDENGNSVWDGGEGVLDNVTINLHGSLDGGGTIDLSTVTDLQGDYLFSGLAPGDYWVLEEVKSWWAAQTYPLTVFHTVADVQLGEQRTDLNFGNDTLCDEDSYETSEICLHGTDDGFSGPEPSNLSPGFLDYLVVNSYDYITEFDQPANNQWFGHTFEGCWDEECEVMAATMRIKLHAASSGQTNTDNLSLGDYSLGHAVSGRIWSINLNELDLLYGSGDGVWSPGEVMTVVLDLADLPNHITPNWLPDNILGALQDGNLDIMVTDETGVDFIEIYVELCCPDGTICGYKFNDLNGDGIQDANEPGLPNWTITLDDGYMLYPQVTGPNGEYCFTGLAAGHYSIYEMGQAGWTQTYPQFVAYEIDLPTSGTGDWNLQNIDFGNYFCDTSEYEIILDSCLAGIKDNFALPTEPASPSPGLLANLQNCSGGADPNFDSDIIDRCFGHSFDECWTQDCPVISAQLHFKVQALSYGSSNDAIYLGDWSAGPGPSTWWIHLNDLAPYSSGTVLDYTFDLGNMPVAGHGPRNLLPYLQDKKLDVLIEDDTKVDFLELIFELCCPDCCELRGDINHDGVIDISDLVYLVDWMFTGGPPPPCPEEADMNGDGAIDIADLVYLVDYMFNGGPAPVPCDQKAPAAKPISQQSDISFDVEYANDISTVVMNSPIDLRGIQLELKGTGPAPANLVGDHVDMIHGRDGWVVKVGLLDLDGGEIISADTREVVRFDGKYTLEAVTVADVDARSITPTIGIALKQNELPTVYTLSQNYPNPFNPSTSIRFALPEAAEVRLEVFNLLGQRVTTLLNQRLEAGNHTAEWNSQNELGQTVASGVYFYRLETPRFTESRKMVLLK